MKKRNIYIFIIGIVFVIFAIITFFNIESIESVQNTKQENGSISLIFNWVTLLVLGIIIMCIIIWQIIKRVSKKKIF